MAVGGGGGVAPVAGSGDLRPVPAAGLLDGRAELRRLALLRGGGELGAVARRAEQDGDAAGAPPDVIPTGAAGGRLGAASRLTTHRVPFREIERGFRMMQSKEDGILKPLILFDQDRR